MQCLIILIFNLLGQSTSFFGRRLQRELIRFIPVVQTVGIVFINFLLQRMASKIALMRSLQEKSLRAEQTLVCLKQQFEQLKKLAGN